MTPDRIALLTEPQRLCLRLVYAHLTSKEIAPHLGMTSASVDQFVKSAVRTLGASDRRAAAQILAEHEKGAHPAYQSPGLAAAPESTLFAPSAEHGWRPGPSTDALNEERAAARAPPPAPVFALPLSMGGPDEVGWRRRLGWIAAMAIGMAIAFGALVSALEVLTRLVRN